MIFQASIVAFEARIYSVLRFQLNRSLVPMKEKFA